MALLTPLEHLVCDVILEVYILEMRPKMNNQLLPNLKTINKIPLDVTDLSLRTKHKEALKLHD